MTVNEDEVQVVLINPPYAQRRGGGKIAPIGLTYLAASLEACGATVAIVDLAKTITDYRLAETDSARLREQAAAVFDRFPAPLIVGVGPLTTASLRAAREILLVAQEVTSAALIAGGPLCAVPNFGEVCRGYLPLDAFVAGDGEHALVRMWHMLRSASRGPLSAEEWLTVDGVGVYGYRPPKPARILNLDELPLPARHLLVDDDQPSARRTVRNGRTTSAFLSRGCPYSCSFCAAPLSSGRKVRRLSPARVTSEIAGCIQLGIDNIIFYDDCLFIRSGQLNARILEFCEALSAANWDGTFQLELRCDAVNAISDDALGALRDTGCRQVNMGIEKGHTAQLQQLRKRLEPADAELAAARLSATGIRAAGTFIVGGVGETEGDVQRTIDFACSLDLAFAHFNPLAVYPGTRLYDEIFGNDADWLSHCLDTGLAPLGDILWRDDNLPLSRILDNVQVGYKSFYTMTRLARILDRVPATERTEVIQAYRILAEQRGHSWDTATDHIDTVCGA